jgi:hypothetical protein
VVALHSMYGTLIDVNSKIEWQQGIIEESRNLKQVLKMTDVVCTVINVSDLRSIVTSNILNMKQVNVIFVLV